MSRVHYERYEEHFRKGMADLEAGRTGEARRLLMAAAMELLKSVGDGDPGLRQIRYDKAMKIRDMAVNLPQGRPPPEKGAGAGAVAGAGAAARDEGLTPADQWLVSVKPDVRFDQIAGLEDLKESIRLRVIYPVREAAAARRFRKRAGGGALLYGPPGTGKTMIAKAIATEVDAAFYNVKCSNVMSQWVGVAERNLAKLFEHARSHPVSVVFLDETEALVGKRGGHSTVMNRVIPEFLAQVDGLEKQDACVLLVGATNRPWDMDEAALRPGRFGEAFYVGLPDAPARGQILRLNLEGIPSEGGIDLQGFADKLDGFSGADIAGLCVRATDLPFQRQIRTGADAHLTAADLEAARGSVRPSVGEAQLYRYRVFERTRQ